MRILLLGLAFFLPSLSTWFYFHGAASTGAGLGLYAFSKVIALALPLIWILYIARERLSLPRPDRRALLAGVASGTLIGGVLLAGYFFLARHHGFIQAGAEAITDKLAGFGVTTPIQFLGLSLFMILINASIEEYYWRGFLFKRLAERVPWVAAAGLSALGFMLHHAIILSGYFGPLLVGACSLGVVVGGLVWAYQYHRTRNIFSAWVSHALVDAAVYLIAFDLLFGQ